mmetsp:Transcript_15527/g.10896  ORF Transcript_15527/g.10896 Transcript_15527/m.10896 type:complete len:123 (-) Transcript_15527:76-444(-)
MKAKVDKADNGVEAVALFRKSLEKTCCNVHYRIVLMDLNMPIMDGFEATTRILQMQSDALKSGTKNLKECKVAALTAFVNQETIDFCYKTGFSEVLYKPANFSVLEELVEKYCPDIKSVRSD